jgi:dUTP pyrophosphatase
VSAMTIRYRKSAGVEFRRHSKGASGFDLQSTIDGDIAPAGGRLAIPTGIYLEMPLGIEAQVRNRSGLWFRHGVWCPVGTIDSDYRGEVSVMLCNESNRLFHVGKGDRIAQLVFSPVIMDGVRWGEDFVEILESTSLSATERGAGGFGSTGR